MKTEFTRTQTTSGLWLAVFVAMLICPVVYAQTPITCGQTITNSTTAESEIDIYTYAGTSGEKLSFVLWGPVNCFYGDAMVADIYNPSGQLLATLNGCDTLPANLTLTNSGTFTILVHESYYRGSGSYSLTIQSLTGGGCNPRTITCGQTVVTNTTFNTEMQGYSYAGTSGEKLSFVLWGPVNCFYGDAMVADIYNPSGQLLATLNGCDTLPANLTLTNSGTFTILVHESYYRGSGSYSLTIQSLTGGGCGGVPIVCGQIVNSNISQSGEMLAYGFGTGGGSTLFTFGGGSFAGVEFDLYDPAGTKLFTHTPGTTTNISLAAGTYTLLVHDDNYSNIGGYSFSVTCFNPCTYSIAPASVSVGADAANGSVAVTAGIGCTWAATNNVGWLSITSGSSGSGNGTVNYSVAANLSTSDRAGTLTIAGWSFRVNQVGALALAGSDVGNPGAAGGFGFTNGVYAVRGSGEDIQDTADDFHFVHAPLVGDGQIIARVTGLAGLNVAAEAGVMIRETLDAGSKHAFLRLDTKTNAVFRRRLAPGAFSVETPTIATNHTWLRLMRQGDTFIGHSSSNGVDWQYVWFSTVSMSNQVHAGLAVTAHQYSQMATGTFDNVSITGLAPLSGAWPLPAPKILLGGDGVSVTEFNRVGGFKFLVGGGVGDQFLIKSTTNIALPFASWPSLTTVTNDLGISVILDPQAVTNARSFYRAQRAGP